MITIDASVFKTVHTQATGALNRDGQTDNLRCASPVVSSIESKNHAADAKRTIFSTSRTRNRPLQLKRVTRSSLRNVTNAGVLTLRRRHTVPNSRNEVAAMMTMNALHQRRSGSSILAISRLEVFHLSYHFVSFPQPMLYTVVNKNAPHPSDMSRSSVLSAMIQALFVRKCFQRHALPRSE